METTRPASIDIGRRTRNAEKAASRHGAAEAEAEEAVPAVEAATETAAETA